eukprot:9162723-Alexandrium_andersonii.AAC.1
MPHLADVQQMLDGALDVHVNECVLLPHEAVRVQQLVLATIAGCLNRLGPVLRSFEVLTSALHSARPVWATPC